jgi:ABC-type uncharacterized transport system permease subunit
MELTDRRVLIPAGLILAVLAALVTLPPLTVENPLVPIVLAGASVLAGLAVMRKDWATGLRVILAAGAGLLVALIDQHADNQTVKGVITAGLFASMLAAATPLVFGALGGLYSERSGVVNIGLEGMMLMGCFWGIYCDDKAGSWVVGLIGAAVAGGLMASVHAFFAIHLRADQIVSGTAMNILALGITTYAFRSLYGDTGTPNVDRIPNIHLPIKWIPWVGDVFDTLNLMTWLMLILVVLSWLFLFKTPWGLRLRAVGEHPRAADTVGIPVFAVRYAAVITSGALAALGGAYLSFGLLGAFSENMTAGRGFIALAALIFGKWKPYGLLAAALLFGFARALGDALQSVASISADLVSILPYALTLVALVGLVGRSTPPAADGIPYKKQ